MPKREATPPPGDDEPRYLTICYPYPPHANMELHGDRLALARWLACCMRTSDDLYAIFHKPSAPNMITIEVRRDHDGFRRLLGAHRWSEFVKSPGEHSDKITRIYFSTFPTGRAVEKAGWKRIFVADDWFRGFSPNNKYIVHPYPISGYCDPPSEDQTGFTLCRPIPREMFFIPIPAPPPVPVGSADWVSRKESTQGNTKKSYFIASATGSLKGAVHPPASLLPELQMPIPSMARSIALGAGAARYKTGSVRSHSSSPASYHSSSPVRRPQNGGNTTGLSENGDKSSISGDYCSMRSVGAVESNDTVAGGYFDAPNIEDEFGALSLHPTVNKDGTPLCPSHGVICKKGICRDYSALLRRIERKKTQSSYNTGHNNVRQNNARRNNGGPAKAETDSNGFSSVTRGRGRGTYRGRGFSPRGFPRGRAFAGGSR